MASNGVHEYSDCSKVLGFDSDGCSGGFSKWWKKLTGKKCPFYLACVKHDCEYFEGGGIPFIERFKADWNLMLDVMRGGILLEDGTLIPFEYEGEYKRIYGIIWGPLMFIGVRIGGWKYWPTPFRWEYGEDYILAGRLLPEQIKERFRQQKLKDGVVIDIDDIHLADILPDK